MEEREKILREMIFKLEGDWDWCGGGTKQNKEKNYQKLGTELLQKWQKLTNYYPEEQLQEIKELLEKIKNNQVKNMEKYQVSSLCRELFEKC